MAGCGVVAGTVCGSYTSKALGRNKPNRTRRCCVRAETGSGGKNVIAMRPLVLPQLNGTQATGSSTPTDYGGSNGARDRRNGMHNGAANYNGNGNGTGVRQSNATVAGDMAGAMVVTQARNGNGNGNGNGVYVAAPRRNGTYIVANDAVVAPTAASEKDGLKRNLANVDSTAVSIAPSNNATQMAASLSIVPLEGSVQDDLLTDVEFRWAADSYSKTRRTADTWSFIAALRLQLWLLDAKWSYRGGFTEAKKSERARKLAIFVRESLLQLGPTFIKIGQLFSTRSDLLPIEFVEELAKLQDRVPAFAPTKAVAIIEQQLGQPLSRLFKDFEMRPIAAASLGQVHRATLHSGERVVVKVQRPGLKQLFDIDLNNLRVVAEQLDKAEDGRDYVGIYEECASILYKEIDYINEGRNADRFRRNFRNVPWVRVPKVYWAYSTPSVLTLQYLPGVKISSKDKLQAQGLNTKQIAARATEAYLMQILRHGFFHADPHPGNISVDTAGSLVFYDFGMMGEIVPTVRENLLEVFYGIYKKNSMQVINALVALEVIKPTGDLLSVKRSVSFFIEDLGRRTAESETLNAIGEDLFAIALDQPFRFPATFTFVLRSFVTLEGIGKLLDSEYTFATVAKPYAQELLDLQDAQAAQRMMLEQLQQQANEFGQAAATMPTRVAYVADVLERVEAGELKLRVRVLESERAARRSGVLQVATINSIAATGMLNLGAMAAFNGNNGVATVALLLSVVFGAMVFNGFKRVERLDKFERRIRGG